ncbi:MAG: ATP-dependent helicase [Desulfobacterales bacterium]|nr:ATP-dependent helicase [Desulfobacterales bacterium]
MLKMFAPQDKALCVIGDPDQSIYGFRGSDIRYFNKFLNDYPKAQTINLVRNYRSTETILEASFQVIAQNHTNFSEHRVYSGIDGTKTLSIFECLTEKSEAVTIGKTIEQMIGGTGFHSIDFGKIDDTVDRVPRGFSDFAVLYRTSNQGQIVADVFDTAGIPYQIVNKKNILYQNGIQELIAFLKVSEGCGSYSDFDKIMHWNTGGVGKKTLNNFKMWAYQNGYSLDEALGNVKLSSIQGIKAESQQTLSEFVDDLYIVKKTIKEFPIEKKLNYLSEHIHLESETKNNPKIEEAFNYLITISRKFGLRSSDFITEITLQTDPDFYDPRAEKVSLMTMHAAKGLEFPIVFIIGCEKDYIPFKRSTHEKPNIEEERRLFYVAMTRAQEKLYLSYAKKRLLYGKLLNREISPFVSDIEKRLKKYEPAFNLKHKTNNHYQLKLF